MWDLLGDLHPFFVHFPVALILFAAVAEVLFVVRKDQSFGGAARFMIHAAALMSVPAAIAGFAGASGEQFTGTALRLFAVHRIVGITTPVLAFLASGMTEGSRRSGQVWEQGLYRVLLALAVISVAIAGYAGALLAHHADH